MGYISKKRKAVASSNISQRNNGENIIINDISANDGCNKVDISIHKCIESGINVKLWNRFWEAIAMNDSGATYEQVLQSLFGAKSESNIKNHKNIKNFKTNLKLNY
jgi:hypothetical protein